MMKVRIGWYRKQGISLLVLVGMLVCIVSVSTAQQEKQSSSKTEAEQFRIDSASQFTPTRTGAPGTVASYFWPTTVGTSWTHRTVRLRMDDSGRVVASDTSYNTHLVVSDTSFSLQRLPIVECRTEGYVAGSKDTAKGVAYYYVDDSIAMTVMNNSVTHRLNAIFLVSPLQKGNAWHERYDDSTYCVISGRIDSVITPLQRFDSVLLTVTRAGYTELVKMYAEGYGLIKSVFRAPGPGNHGMLAMITEMVALVPADKKKVLGNNIE